MSDSTESISYLQAIAISVGAIIGWGAYIMPGDLFLPQSREFPKLCVTAYNPLTGE